MGQGISDIFYPDNPNRRNRAEQLSSDIKAYCNSYEEIKKARSLFHQSKGRVVS
jgi:predicted lipoprotein